MKRIIFIGGISLIVCCSSIIGYLSIPKYVFAHSTHHHRQEQATPQLYILNANDLVMMKRKYNHHDSSAEAAYKYIINSANSLLIQKPVSVMDKSQVPPSGNKHDYLSLAPYSWPNPDTASGLPYVTRDGQTNPETLSISDYNNLEMMSQSVSTLSLAYYFSGNEQYADRAVLFLRTWFINPDTKMNPNLTYAQVVKGSNNVSGGGIIDGYNFPKVLDAIGLLTQSTALQRSDKDSLDQWFADYLQWLLMSKKGELDAKATNNQGSWYDVQISSIALFLNKKDLADQILEDSKTKLIANQIEPDGSQPQELSRTQSFDYSVFNLQALFELATIAQNDHIDLWHYQTQDGRSIQKALDYLASYPENKQWHYEQITNFNINGLLSQLKLAAIVYDNASYSQLADKQNIQMNTDNFFYFN